MKRAKRQESAQGLFNKFCGKLVEKIAKFKAKYFEFIEDTTNCTKISHPI